MATIRINDLKVRTIIGAYPWERVNKQELIINITIEYDATKPCRSDKLSDALNYETVAKGVARTVQASKFILLEKLCARLLDSVMKDKRVIAAYIRVDKPHALPEALSVSFELAAQR